MLTELDALGSLYPRDGYPEVTDAYLAFREAHHHYWFDKWFNKNKRKL